MTATSRASEVWLLLVDPQLEPDPYRAVDMLMEMDGVEREEAVRRLHEVAAEWIGERHCWWLGYSSWSDGLTSTGKACSSVAAMKLEDASNEVSWVRHEHNYKLQWKEWWDAFDRVIGILRLIQSLPQ